MDQDRIWSRDLSRPAFGTISDPTAVLKKLHPRTAGVSLSGTEQCWIDQKMEEDHAIASGVAAVPIFF